jgi:hypothetical protein
MCAGWRRVRVVCLLRQLFLHFQAADCNPIPPRPATVDLKSQCTRHTLCTNVLSKMSDTPYHVRATAISTKPSLRQQFSQAWQRNAATRVSPLVGSRAWQRLLSSSCQDQAVSCIRQTQEAYSKRVKVDSASSCSRRGNLQNRRQRRSLILLKERTCEVWEVGPRAFLGYDLDFWPHPRTASTKARCFVALLASTNTTTIIVCCFHFLLPHPGALPIFWAFVSLLMTSRKQTCRSQSPKCDHCH